jgi:hypothetical protein
MPDNDNDKVQGSLEGEKLAELFCDVLSERSGRGASKISSHG